MRRQTTIRAILKTLILMVTVNMLVFICLTPAIYADPPNGVRHAPGKVVSRLPSDHRVVHVGKSRYFVHGNHFYVKKPAGFIPVRAPLGAVVVSIPIGARAELFGGTTFYVSNDVYYRKVPEGYLVVKRPAHKNDLQEASFAEPSYRVARKMAVVQADKLNVRSGPGLNFPIVQQVRRHHTLTIHGYAPEWLYVEINDEKETTARIAAITQENEGVQFSHGLCAKCFKTEMVKLESHFGTNASTGISMPGKRLA